MEYRSNSSHHWVHKVVLLIGFLACSCESSDQSTDRRVRELKVAVEAYVQQMNQTQEQHFKQHGAFWAKPSEIPSKRVPSLQASSNLELKKCYEFHTVIEEKAVFSYAKQFTCSGFWGSDLDEVAGGVFIISSTHNSQSKTTSIVCSQHPNDLRVEEPVFKNGILTCPRAL